MLDSKFKAIDLGPIKAVLHDVELPDLPPGPVGRFRLVAALRNRFGNNYRIMEASRRALKHFDSETKLIKGYIEAKGKIDDANAEYE